MKSFLGNQIAKLLTVLIVVVLVTNSCTVTKIVTYETPDYGKKPKNIILMIGDGMGLSQTSAGMYSQGNFTFLEFFQFIGLVKTHASNNLITDSAASATAYATGQKTYNGAIAVDTSKRKLTTILELAEDKGLSTGVVATSSVTHATPASFYAHKPKRKQHYANSLDLVRSNMEVMFGGGYKYLTDRVDNRNLLDTLDAQGYSVYRDIDDVQVSKNTEQKVACFIADEEPPGTKQGRGDYLRKASTKACDILTKDDDGFFLMIEGSQIDWGGHGNSSEFIIDEFKDFDQAIKEVLAFASKDGETLVIVTADHETGGYAINSGDFNGKIEGKFTSTKHTATMVPIYAYGPGAEAFTGIYENTVVFDKMKWLLNL